MSYKGYMGSVEFEEARILYGRLEVIRALAPYEATDGPSVARSTRQESPGTRPSRALRRKAALAS